MATSNRLTLKSGGEAADMVKGSIFFIGNATVLIRYAGYTILTDPTFIHMHEQVSIGYGLHATRLTNPAIDIHQLPPLDLVVLSHFHGDHFDQVAERELDKALPIVTTNEASKALAERGFANARPLGTWSSIDIGKAEVIFGLRHCPAATVLPFHSWCCQRLWEACWSSSPHRTRFCLGSTSAVTP